MASRGSLLQTLRVCERLICIMVIDPSRVERILEHTNIFVIERPRQRQTTDNHSAVLVLHGVMVARCGWFADSAPETLRRFVSAHGLRGQTSGTNPRGG